MNKEENGVTIRQPSTANLMIDSADRQSGQNWSDFLINRNYSIMNGFFTRIATTEVVLEWCVPNITPSDTFKFQKTDLSGAIYTITPDSPGFYTVEQLLDNIAKKTVDLSGTSGVYAEVATSAGGAVYLEWFDTANPANPVSVAILSSPLQVKLKMTPNDFAIVSEIAPCADLRPYRYIDFASNQLTYCQDLKDSSTTPNVRDVLCRWYFADDVPVQYDAYGFPIEMGYKPFRLRRLFNPPKYIKWDNIQPIGQIGFQTYDDEGDLIQSTDPDTNFLMTLQISEN
jgi:hypothetical protein